MKLLLLASLLLAQAHAQANIPYAYPPPGSKHVVAPVSPGPKPVLLAKASKALKAALEQLGSAGSGPNERFLELAIHETQQALAAVQKAALEAR